MAVNLVALLSWGSRVRESGMVLTGPVSGVWAAKSLSGDSRGETVP